MSDSAIHHHRRPIALVVRLSAVSVAALIATLLTTMLRTATTVHAQPPRSATPTQPAVNAPSLAGLPDLQGIWDFTMRMGERSSPGFLAIGPVEDQWAGSITMYLTNTLAIRALTVKADSVRMIVVSREGDVTFNGRLLEGGRTMEGIVDYHGGVRVPMKATRRAQPAVPR